MNKRKKFIFLLLIIFLDMHTKFFHNKKKIKKNSVRGFKNKSIFTAAEYINKDTVNQVIDVKSNKNIDISNDEKTETIKNIFYIDENKIEKGFSFLNEMKNNYDLEFDQKIEAKKIYIGRHSFSYEVDSGEKGISIFDLQNFINNHMADLLILFIIKSFLMNNNTMALLRCKRILYYL